MNATIWYISVTIVHTSLTKTYLLFITCPYSSHHEKQLLLTSFSDNFIQIWYLISYPMY